MVDFLLLENGSKLLQENGSFILLGVTELFNLSSKIFILGRTPFDNKLIRNDSIIKLKRRDTTLSIR